MAWTNPRTWFAGEIVDEATMNQHIRDNLQYLFDRIQIGTASVTPSAPNTPTAVTVTFPVPFPSTPFVVASVASGVPGTTVLGVGADQETTTDFRLSVTRTNTTLTVCRWIAVLP